MIYLFITKIIIHLNSTYFNTKFHRYKFAVNTIKVVFLWKEGNEVQDFSEIAKELRETKKLTQTQLAERMWVKKSIISAYETDARPPSLDMLVKYAKEFNVSTDYLLGLESDKKISVDGLTDSQINILLTLINEFKKES